MDPPPGIVPKLRVCVVRAALSSLSSFPVVQESIHFQVFQTQYYRLYIDDTTGYLSYYRISIILQVIYHTTGYLLITLMVSIYHTTGYLSHYRLSIYHTTGYLLITPQAIYHHTTGYLLITLQGTYIYYRISIILQAIYHTTGYQFFYTTGYLLITLQAIYLSYYRLFHTTGYQFIILRLFIYNTTGYLFVILQDIY